LYDTIKVNWHEVKKVSAENAQTEQLPYWVKAGEYMYLPEKGEYFKITEDFMTDNLICEKITAMLAGKIKQARKRPFNEKEMKALVGKVFKDDCGIVSLVIGYDSKNIGTAYRHYSAEDLILYNYTIDGKPCYVLEHLENGEWVE
jgi:hypothetical protein